MGRAANAATNDARATDAATNATTATADATTTADAAATAANSTRRATSATRATPEPLRPDERPVPSDFGALLEELLPARAASELYTSLHSGRRIYSSRRRVLRT